MNSARYMLIVICLAFGLYTTSRATGERGPVSAELGKRGEEYRPVRVLEDPGTRTRWSIERNTVHPSSPGRMIPVSEDPGATPQVPQAGKPILERSRDVTIHAGDSVVVTERNRIVDMRVQGIALNSAETGEALRVRLKIVESTVTALVTGPGRAKLVAHAVEVRR